MAIQCGLQNCSQQLLLRQKPEVTLKHASLSSELLFRDFDVNFTGGNFQAVSPLLNKTLNFNEKKYHDELAKKNSDS